jgi:hypothetical protein
LHHSRVFTNASGGATAALDQPDARKTEGVMTERKSIPVGLRTQIFIRDSYTCQYCGRRPARGSDVVLEIDHHISVAEGGTNDAHNLRTSCWDCNRGKGKRILPAPKSPEEQAEAKELERERIRQIEEYRAYSKRVYEEKKKAKRRLKKHWGEMIEQDLTTRELEGLANKLQFFDVHEIMEAIGIAASKQLDSYVPYVHGILNRWLDDPASRPQLGPRHEAQTTGSRPIRPRPTKPTSRLGHVCPERNEVPARQRTKAECGAGDRNGFLAVTLFEDLEPTDLNRRYTLVRWHMLDLGDWTLDDMGAEECSFAHFHMAAAWIPPNSIPLESRGLDKKAHPRGQAPLRDMPGYVTSWMVKGDELRGHDPQAVLDGWLRGTKDGDIQKYRELKAMYMLSLWLSEPTDTDLRGYSVCRAKVPANGEEPKFDFRGTWYLHEAMSWLPPPTLMMAEWQMEMFAPEKKEKGRFRRTATEDGPLAVWYAPAEAVEGPYGAWVNGSASATPADGPATGPTV